MIETGVLIDVCHQPIHWHLPAGRLSVYLPDSPDLWDVIWKNRNSVLGFAHSHPGSGQPRPSAEDLSTFRAIEKALGKELLWWITSRDSLSVVALFRHVVDGKKVEEHVVLPTNLSYPWLVDLRKRSYEGAHNE